MWCRSTHVFSFAGHAVTVVLSVVLAVVFVLLFLLLLGLLLLLSPPPFAGATAWYVGRASEGRPSPAAVVLCDGLGRGVLKSVTAERDVCTGVVGVWEGEGGV
jgi:uncharacterized protein (DUF58 family)